MSEGSSSSHPHMVESDRHNVDKKQVAEESVQYDPISTKFRNIQYNTIDYA